MNRRGELHSPPRVILHIFLLLLACSGLYASSLYSYLLFHSLIEAFCVVVALTIFVLTWNARKLLDNHYFLFLGISFLSSATIELVHLFAFKGFGIFPADANLPTQLYIAFRYVVSVSFLIAPAFIARRIDGGAVLAVFAAFTALLITAIFSGNFPDCYIEGRGLTPFKIYSEYVIIVILLTAFGLLIHKRAVFDPGVFRMLALSLFCGVAAEVAYTQYLSVFGPANMIGHFFQFLSAVLIFRAIFVTGVERPMSIIFRNLEKNEMRFRLIAETSVDLIFQLDLAGKVVFCSPAIAQYGYSITETLGRAFSTFFVDDDRELAAAAFQRTMEGEHINSLGLRLSTRDGLIHKVEINSAPLTVDGEVIGLQGISRDVTSRSQAEELIKASLREKEVMLREIHHRVKNNLQVISSLVSLQADSLDDQRIRDELTEVRDRILSMALVHEKLYQTSNLDQLNFAEYASSLLHYLWRSHGALAQKVRLNITVAPVVLPIEAAVPCGLVLNELAGNALKHAFPDGTAGEVAVGLDHDPAQGEIRLQVQDNGVGMPPGLDWRQTNSLGLRLVQILVRQLQGRLEVETGPGTSFCVTFSPKGTPCASSPS